MERINREQTHRKDTNGHKIKDTKRKKEKPDTQTAKRKQYIT